MKKLFIFMAALFCCLSMSAVDGVLFGKFTINSKGDQVRFAQGNLQYQKSTKTWRFAQHQYDMIGRHPEDWIDLFGWGTANNPTLETENNDDYTTFVDWGKLSISNGGNQPDLWRTLDWEEWLYIFLNRPNAAMLRGQGTVEGVHGYILLPDDWELPKKLSFTPEVNNWTTNTYNVYQWIKMEVAGALFLPAAGFRTGNEVGYPGLFGFYWSSSLFNDLASGDGRDFFFSEKKVGPRDHEKRFYGLSVRLVATGKEPQAPQPAPLPEPRPDRRPKHQPVVAPEGALQGVFSVGEKKQVWFAKGNLQYQATTKTWRFAESQEARMATANVRISSNNTEWIDLFGWGTGKEPLLTTTDYPSYGTFVDWGINPISNGGNKAGEWRTLSDAEWAYLYCTRPNAEKLFAYGTVNNVKGIIVLPDNWEQPEGLVFVPSTNKGIKRYGEAGYAHFESSSGDFGHNVYSTEQWELMEENGAMFLPVTGFRSVTRVVHTYDEGYYWTSTPAENTNSALSHSFYAGRLGTQGSEVRYYGMAVRLAQDKKEIKQPQHPVDPTIHHRPDRAPKGSFSINAKGEKVEFAKGNLQYQASTKSWRFAAHQWDILASANSKIASDNNGWIDLFGWGTGDAPAKSSQDDAKYDSYFEWGANAIQNGGNKAGEWRTLSRDEWVYLLCSRANAINLFGLGTVCGVNGLILLPDNWQAPEGVSFAAGITRGLALHGSYYKNPKANNFEHNFFTAEQWAKMEAAGAVFLPVAHFRVGREVRVGNGNYWTSSRVEDADVRGVEAKYLDFDKGYVGMGSVGAFHGMAVRLVRTVK